MTPANVNLSGAPTWTVEAAYSKNRERGRSASHPKLVEAFRPWLAGKDAALPLWPGKWAENTQAGVMMNRDLESAGIVYRDARKRVADFHSLRHTFITNLHRAGVSPKVIQFLARHSAITLTMDLYTRVEMEDQAASLVGMPFLPDLVSKTDMMLSPACTKLGQTGVPACPDLESDGGEGVSNDAEDDGRKYKRDKEFGTPCPSLW